ncbi:unnamed protein product [Prunus armeniaca]|uniref:Purple acid phosphatase n=1 Tax=Prunus armeniaca TaxID=36596 RepID=A0A6J5VLT8_PRUAR|nr:unnamed protein product [Prunus armeniaca]
MPLDSDVFQVPPGHNAPQEGNAVIVSWITADEPGYSGVIYWSADSKNQTSEGVVTTYTFYNYTSGYIHHCTIGNLSVVESVPENRFGIFQLKFNTTYYYVVGIGNTERQFWFTTPPEVGRTTLTHYALNPLKGQTVLYLGDLSYADDYPYHDNVRWDTWGRFTERSAGVQGIMRLILPQNLVKQYLLSLTLTGPSTPQYQWLETELPKVNRSETPWLIVIMHCPWYNSYYSHYMEGEGIRVTFEPWFVKYKIDVVFNGTCVQCCISNVAYNVVNANCTPVKDQSAPVYVTVGDGGNLEGLSTVMTEPQPD